MEELHECIRAGCLGAPEAGDVEVWELSGVHKHIQRLTMEHGSVVSAYVHEHLGLTPANILSSTCGLWTDDLLGTWAVTAMMRMGTSL